MNSIAALYENDKLPRHHYGFVENGEHYTAVSGPGGIGYFEKGILVQHPDGSAVPFTTELSHAKNRLKYLSGNEGIEIIKMSNIEVMHKLIGAFYGEIDRFRELSYK